MFLEQLYVLSMLEEKGFRNDLREALKGVKQIP